MKFIKTTKLFVLFAAFVVLFSGCDPVSPGQETDAKNDIRIPASFNFKTTADVQIHLNAVEIDDHKTLARIYYGDPRTGGKLIQQVNVENNSSVTTRLSLAPHFIENLYVASNLPNGLSGVNKLDFSGNESALDIYTTFKNDNSDNDAGLIPAPAPINAWLSTAPIIQTFESGNLKHIEARCWIIQGAGITSTNAISGSYSFETNPLGAANQQASRQLISPWLEFNGSGYITFKHAANNNNNSGNLIVTFVDKHGNTLYNNPIYTYDYSEGILPKHVVLPVPSEITGLYRVKWEFFGTRGSGSPQRSYLDDVTISAANASAPGTCNPLSTPPVQSEFDNFIPGEGMFATLAFEDNWPGFGDYDMNDLVLDYNINEVTNQDNEIIRLEYTKVIRARGGVFNSGFGIQLPVAPSAISRVEGQRLANSIVNNASNGTEFGHDRAVIIFWDDTSKNMPAISNVVQGSTHIEEDVLDLVIVFANPVSREQLRNAPYNPFIFVHGERNEKPHGGRGHEIHLKGHEPTAKADQSLFGTASDITDPADDVYYTSREQLNWAINIPVSFVYPTSKTSIMDAYVHYKDWAESGGTSFPDWYLDKPENLIESKVYRKP